MGRRPEPRISLVTLAVGDLDASLVFYRDGLGWTPGFANDDVAFFQLNGVILGLWRRAQMAKELGIPAAELVPGGMEVAHNVRSRPEVDEVIQAAVAAGGRLVKPAKEAPWGGYTGHVADPDGYRWEVAWNPGWTITEDGATRLGPG
jgi:catechol 2,3-dioxygenase-like lactoylglutathione lyase family enzyme